MKLKALNDDILLEVEAIDEISKGGIVIARSTVKDDRALCQIGRIIDIGPTAVVHIDDDTKVKIGDKVLFTRYAGMLVPKEVAGERALRIVKEDDLHMLLD